MRHDPRDLGLLILVRTIPQERALCLTSDWLRKWRVLGPKQTQIFFDPQLKTALMISYYGKLVSFSLADYENAFPPFKKISSIEKSLRVIR